MIRRVLLMSAAIAAIVIASASVAYGASGGWTQIGDRIEGEHQFDAAGEGLAISADGRTVAVGSAFNSDGARHAGHVRVFHDVNGSWIQVGSDIDGVNRNESSGRDIALSADGTVIAIGSPTGGGSGDQTRGVVRVFTLDANSWVQVGVDIEGEAAADRSGYSVALSAGGATVAIGATSNSGNGDSAGHVRVFTVVGGGWQQLGSDIDGEAPDDQFGSGLSLSADGTILAAGSIRSSATAFSVGRLRIFRIVDGDWEQVGASIDGEGELDELGWAVALSADGNSLVVSSWKNGGEANGGSVQVFTNVDDNWMQVGASIEGDEERDEFGRSVDISADGTVIAVGAPKSSASALAGGQVRVFQNVNDEWLQIGPDFLGAEIGDRLGFAVSLSGDGQRVAISSPASPSLFGGSVRVFESGQSTQCGGKVATIVGTPGDDVLTGTAGVDVIAGLQGNDTIRGLGGDDIICGGIGDDVIIGGQGFDVMFGAQGNDTIYFADGQSESERADTAGGRAFGGAGNDDIYGSERWDRMQGGSGNDRLFGFGGRDWIRAGAGRDEIIGGANVDTVHGGNGNDQIWVVGDDIVRGGAGSMDQCFLANQTTAPLISCEVAVL